MTIDTSPIIGGPAVVFYRGGRFFSQGDIVWNNTKATFPIKTDIFQTIDERLMNEQIKLTFTPIGEWDELEVLWPYASTPLGSIVNDDSDLVILTVSGKQITFHNAVVAKMPSIHMSAVKTLMGPVEIDCYLKNNADPQAADARWSIADGAPGDITIDPDKIFTQPYKATWGAAPWADFETKEGWTIDFTESWEQVHTDSLGNVAVRLSGLAVTAKCQPLGINEQAVLDKLLLQGAGAFRGRSLGGDDLDIQGTNVFVRIYKAALKNTAQHFASNLERIGELTWSANRRFVSGIPRPLFHVSTAPVSV